MLDRANGKAVIDLTVLIGDKTEVKGTHQYRETQQENVLSSTKVKYFVETYHRE